jgi:hypothetical protein
MGLRGIPVYLDRALIDEQAIQFLCGFGGGIRSCEGNRSNATAGAILVIGNHDFFDWSSGLMEVFLRRGIKFISIFT